MWGRGVSILLLLIATSFLGYVLPNNQISFWGASVITSLLTEVPYFGGDLVELIWGGTRVCNYTLIRFFSFHFILPFIVAFFVFLHILLLHEEGSSNPLGLNLREKIIFFETQVLIDGLGIRLSFFFVLGVIFFYQDMFGDDERFYVSNRIVTPLHIQPEWYFLFAYAILRAIPNKLGGVIGLVISIFILYFLVLKAGVKVKGFIFNPYIKVYYWLFLVNVIFLSWIGACSVEYPYGYITQLFVVIYFIFFLLYI